MLQLTSTRLGSGMIGSKWGSWASSTPSASPASPSSAASVDEVLAKSVVPAVDQGLAPPPLFDNHEGAVESDTPLDRLAKSTLVPLPNENAKTGKVWD